MREQLAISRVLFRKRVAHANRYLAILIILISLHLKQAHEARLCITNYFHTFTGHPRRSRPHLPPRRWYGDT